MHINQYNNRVTKGQYELNSFQLSSIFPEANPFLIEYILDRSYFNRGDSRVRQSRKGIVAYHSVVFKAAAKTDGGDVFDSNDGEMLIKLKLHDKAARFLNEFRGVLSDDCAKMKDRILHFPSQSLKSDIICADMPKRCGTMVDYSITDSYSYAKWAIPVKGIGGYTTIENICDAVADYACEALRRRKNVDGAANLAINDFKMEFSNEIKDKFLARVRHLGGGNWRVENSSGVVRRVVITVHTKRSPEDKHDPDKAARELVKSLNCSFYKFERIARNIAVRILDGYTRLGSISKALKVAEKARKYCQDRGLVKKDSPMLQSVDRLSKAKLQ